MGLGEKLVDLGKRLLGTSNESALRRFTPIVQAVDGLAAELRGLDDAVLRARAAELLRRVREGGEGLAQVQVEALALARETADRRFGTWGAITGRRPGWDEQAWGEDAALIAEARSRLAAGEPQWAIDLPASAYGRVRTVYPESVPPFRMFAHPVQVVGTMVLHEGCIAELKTGEGKTLVAVFAAYLNALAGRGVHVVTVNDYLAQRDADWNRPILGFLGISVGAIQAGMSAEERRAIYSCDVTYGANNEFGFDYLRDNLKQSLEEQVQTRRDYAIVDEVDSVLIDEARTPLIISGPAQGREDAYQQADHVARQLLPEQDFELDIKDRTASLTEEGIEKATRLFGVSSMYDAEGMHLPHYLDNSLRAHHLFHRDKEYLVVDGEVKIVDEHTGRVLVGRRWSEGLHQAVECKEGVAIQPETATYATITIQNFFRLYKKLAGMTGTAMTEANEFNAIYKLNPVAVPTNKPVVRRDLPDLIYGSFAEKQEAIAKEIEELHAVGQPVLIGTISVEVSETLSEALTRRGVPHNVLNARQHQREAQIVDNAGGFAAVTVSTNMAGRGTDIMLGQIDFESALRHWQKHGMAPKRMPSHDPKLDEACVDLWAKRYLGEDEAAKLREQALEARLQAVNRERQALGYHPLPLPTSRRHGVDVRDLGGLRIIGTERHDARRIDNQLRGRSGRQGDPGSSRFFLSLDDDLMKRFAGPAMASLMRNMGLKDGVPIESRMVSRAVEKAQKRVEEYYFGIRKNVLEYDQVMNVQRLRVYELRQALIEGKDIEARLLDIYEHAIDDMVQQAAADGTRGDALAKKLRQTFIEVTGLEAPAETDIPVREGGTACCTALFTRVRAGVADRRLQLGDDLFTHVCRFVLLETIDRRWKDHIDFMDHLRRGIGLESYGQKDPKLRFKEEGYRRFDNMWELIRVDVARVFFRLQVVSPEQQARAAEANNMFEAGGFAPRELGATPQAGQSLAATPPRAGQPAPDDPCPCGSGRPFRHCHGR